MGGPVAAFALAQDNAFHELIHAGRAFNQASIALDTDAALYSGVGDGGGLSSENTPQSLAGW